MIAAGAVGHRILADPALIRRGIAEVIERIGQRHPGSRIDVISALAEGADRLVAEAILALPDSRLTAVLPMTEPEYRADFRSAESRKEFERLLARADRVVVMDRRPTRDEAYELAARYVVDHCDILIAIWDGRESQGRGGTADTVMRARGIGRPIAWVRAGNRAPGTMDATSLGPDQGSVAYEGF